MSIPWFRWSRMLAALGIACAALISSGPAAAEDAPAEEAESSALTAVVADWNARVLELAIAEDNLLTLKGLRTACLMHLAIHDALNAIDARFEPFAFSERSEEADPLAVTVQAAYSVVAAQYPDQEPMLASVRDVALARVPDAPAKSAGMALGIACAAAAMKERTGDGWDTDAEYTWHPMAPGVYAEFNEHSGTPEGFVFGAGWAKSKPFAIDDLASFRAPPPPPIDSEAYATAFDEVKSVGRFQSISRTPDQTHIALWWKDFVENSHNRLARQLVRAEKLDAWDANRLFALLNMSVYDAYVSSFENKFLYNHWRPYTAIRWAEHDGNPMTAPDPTWNNTHLHTYAFPSYPSAHGMASAAAMNALASVFGDEFAFEMVIAEVDIAGPFSEKLAMVPPTRSFTKFSDAALECALSRVYLGIHFRYDSIVGHALGTKIGKNLVGRRLRPRS